MANNVATVTACDGAPVAVTLAAGAQGAALDAPVVEFDCVVSGPGAVEEAGTRSPLSANFGEREEGEAWLAWVDAGVRGPEGGVRRVRKRRERRCARPLSLPARCPRFAAHFSLFPFPFILRHVHLPRARQEGGRLVPRDVRRVRKKTGRA